MNEPPRVFLRCFVGICSCRRRCRVESWCVCAGGCGCEGQLTAKVARKSLYKLFGPESERRRRRGSILSASQSLASRRVLFRLCLFHKIYHYIPTLRRTLLFPPPYVSTRIDHPNKVDVMSCLTKTCSDSCIPRTSLDWNRLPGSVAIIIDHHLFRSALATIV